MRGMQGVQGIHFTGSIYAGSGADLQMTATTITASWWPPVSALYSWLRRSLCWQSAGSPPGHSRYRHSRMGNGTSPRRYRDTRSSDQRPVVDGDDTVARSGSRVCSTSAHAHRHISPNGHIARMGRHSAVPGSRLGYYLPNRGRLPPP